MGKAVPSADPDAVVRMQKQQLYEREHHQSIVLKLPLGMLKGAPDVSDAAHSGTPQMNPPTDVISATDILRPGAQGPSFTVTGGSVRRRVEREFFRKQRCGDAGGCDDRADRLGRRADARGCADYYAEKKALRRRRMRLRLRTLLRQIPMSGCYTATVQRRRRARSRAYGASCGGRQFGRCPGSERGRLVIVVCKLVERKLRGWDFRKRQRGAQRFHSSRPNSLRRQLPMTPARNPRARKRRV